MHEEHKGHEAMHAEMILIFFVTLLVAQFVLIEWKRRHYKSYSVSTHSNAADKNYRTFIGRFAFGILEEMLHITFWFGFAIYLTHTQ